jgi:hypothetical protein
LIKNTRKLTKKGKYDLKIHKNDHLKNKNIKKDKIKVALMDS